MISRLTAVTIAAALSGVGLASAASLSSTEEPVLDHHQIEVEQCGDTADVRVTWSPAPACDDAGLEAAAGSVPLTEAAEPLPSPTAPAPTTDPVIPESEALEAEIPQPEPSEPASPSPEPTPPGSESGDDNTADGPAEIAGDDGDV